MDEVVRSTLAAALNVPFGGPGHLTVAHGKQTGWLLHEKASGAGLLGARRTMNSGNHKVNFYWVQSCRRDLHDLGGDPLHFA